MLHPGVVLRSPPWLALLLGLAVVGLRSLAEPALPNPPASPPSWWAAQPLVRPSLPPPANPPFANPIDRLAQAASPGPHLPEPDRRTLLRRLTVDLLGWLPLPEEVEAFVADPAPDAFERQVDRLLASPHYGERWARHWLDVAHFAETHGHDQDRPRESAWPYRDYVIRSFNHDTPYARFVEEQIAADALFPDSPELIPALGFLAAGPWDESSLRDIREDTLDRDIGRYIDRDDIVANVMTTFTSVTAHCARCHDHKFDPVPQRDYYALQAVFAGTEKAERLYDSDPRTHRKREYWMRLQTALERHDARLLDELLTPELQRELQAWEASQPDRTVDWVTLAPSLPPTGTRVEFRALPDGSFLVAGPSPPTNSYLFTAPLPFGAPTALRLEVLPDPSLPAQGPGFAENGNFHLTDLRVFARPAGSSDEPLQVPLLPGTADFEQEGWGITKATDPDPATGWGIHPREGRPHSAVFEFVAPHNLPLGTELRVALHQNHGRHHTLGRFRLSLTTAPGPVRAAPLAPSLMAILAVSPRDRTPEQRLALAAEVLGGRIQRELQSLPTPQRVYAGAGVFPANAGQKPFGRPRPVHLLRRGEVLRPLEAATPGALTCIGSLPARFDIAPAIGADGVPLPEEALRRAALARWLSSPENPLVWRSIVNRVWHYHFGHGIAATPNDLGRMGAAPVAPQLLDWLAVTFRDDLGGSFKALHRLILTSHTWRQIAADPQSAGPLQPLRQRLDAETFRDSLLRLTGRLDTTLGGPSSKHFAMSDGIHVTPNVDYAAFDPDAPGAHRRSIYRFLFRTLPDPLMDTLDCPAGDQSMPVRPESFTALQAFALLNHPMVLRYAGHFAHQVAASGDDTDIPRQVRRACALAWQRAPSPDETEAFTRHVRDFGLPHFCRVLLNSNEFHFVD